MVTMQRSSRKLLGEVHAIEVAFLQKACSFVFSGSFCPLRYHVNH